MKIPTLEEIKITTTDFESLRTQLKQARVGNYPAYCELSHLRVEKLEQFLSTLEVVFTDLNISPKFPYPFYIITNHKEISTTFPFVTSFKEIPRYFKIDTKRMTLREQKLLDKIEIIKSQILNEEVQKRLDEYRMNILPQKIIKSLAKESMFLESIAKELSNQKD